MVAANFVNLVVKPEAPLPRAERDERPRGDAPVLAERLRPPALVGPVGDPDGQGLRAREGVLRVPDQGAGGRREGGAESVFLRFEVASKADREKVDWPERANPQDYPQTDARKWPSTLEVSLNGEVVDREDLEDDPADARGVLSHLARFEHGSYGELSEKEVKLSDAVKAALADGRPLVLRLAVPDDADHAGGLCLFGAETGQYPFDPTVIVAAKGELPTDLGVKPADPVTLDRLSARKTLVLGTGESSAPAGVVLHHDRPGQRVGRARLRRRGLGRRQGGLRHAEHAGRPRLAPSGTPRESGCGRPSISPRSAPTTPSRYGSSTTRTPRSSSTANPCSRPAATSQPTGTSSSTPRSGPFSNLARTRSPSRVARPGADRESTWV